MTDQRRSGITHRRTWSKRSALALTLLLCTAGSRAQEPAAPAKAPLSVGPQGFSLQGAPFRILSGEVEYARIPRAYWRDRLRKVRAMGLNSITVYVFWNLHEPRPGVYDFSGQNDVAEFLREAQQEGLHVILRPGPYVCAEWDLGGYPAWLLKDHSMELRSTQPQFMAAAARWMQRLSQELAPLQASRGGPVIAVQVENEYGSFGKDHAYMQDMLQMVRSAFSESLLYTADGADELPAGSLDNVFAGIDFGTGDVQRSLGLLQQFRPGSPVYVAEYWDGWFDHWGDKHQSTDAAQQVADLRTLLHQGASISLYMVDGGTSFGWMNGANSDHSQYQPDVTSYDYDAPLDEAGRPRPKYFAMRDLLAKETHTAPPPVPASPPLIAIPKVAFTRALSLWKALPAAISSETPLSMEDIGQAYGYILYRTAVQGSGVASSGSTQSGPTDLSIQGLHSYARVYVDGQLAGVIDRRLGQTSLPLALKGSHTLDILVENTGRINFTVALRGERAGVISPVLLGGAPLSGWKIYPLPFAPPPSTGFRNQPCSGPCLYQAGFSVDTPGDTFLNTQHLNKGVLWVNGHLLGRFWDVGPSGSLYLPGAWLRPGRNTITLLDLNGGSDLSVEGQTNPTNIAPQAESIPVSYKP